VTKGDPREDKLEPEPDSGTMPTTAIRTGLIREKIARLDGVACERLA
jgi:hypothetical protein